MAQNYTEYKKTCRNGYAQYYGGSTDSNGVTTWTEINGSEFVSGLLAVNPDSTNATLGCPPSGSFVVTDSAKGRGGGSAWRSLFKTARTKVMTSKFRTTTAAVARGLDMPRVGVDAVNSIEWLAPIMLMELRNANISISNKNNFYEILTRYGQLKGVLRPTDQQIREVMNPKSGEGGGGMGGAGGIIEGILGLVGGIADAVNSGNTQAFLNQFSQQYQQYMTNDFGSIDQTLNATSTAPGPWGGWGPQGALDMLIQFKNSSWQNLFNTISTYCSQKGVEVPNVVKDYTNTKIPQKETSLRQLLASTNNPGGHNTSNMDHVTGNVVPHDGSGGTTNTSNGTGWNTYTGNNRPGGGGPVGGSLMKWIPWVVGGILFLVLVVWGISALTKRKKSKAA